MALLTSSDLGNITLSPGTTGGSNIIHPEFASDIIKSTVESSRALQMFQSRRVPTGVLSIPVLSALPSAYWVDPSGGYTTGGGASYKRTTSQAWQGVTLKLAEIAAIVPIPLVTLEDAAGSGVDLWAEIRPYLGQAIALEVDNAVFFGGTGGATTPSGWASGLVTQAIAAGHTHDLSVLTGAAAVYDGNPAAEVRIANDMLADIEVAGFEPTQFFAGRAFKSTLRGLQDSQGAPVYLSSFRDDMRASSLLDVPIEFMPADSWDASSALLLAGDTSTAMIGYSTEGMRVDVLTEATIDTSAARDGSETINLAQQNMVALRVSTRFAFATAQPVTATGDNGFAWSVMVP